jgi:hypothetical protein
MYVNIPIGAIATQSRLILRFITPFMRLTASIKYIMIKKTPNTLVADARAITTAPQKNLFFLIK